MSEERTFDEAASTQSDNGILPSIVTPIADEAVLPDAAEDEGDIAIGEDDDVYDDDVDDDDSGFAYMQNRELSWLTFNERVLDQGADESVPLLERLNFISIFWSNLQEFFMVRVGSLTDLSFIEPPVTDSKTGMTAVEQIKAIHERCHELYPIQESTYEHVRGSLAKEGVRHLRPEDLSDEQRNYLFGLVRHNIEPFLSPQIINSRHPFPHLENGKLYILVRLDDEASEAERKKKKKKDKAKKDKGGAEGVVLGLIPLPHQCERVIKLPGRGFQFILLEHAIEMFVPEIFSMYKIKHTNVICVTRNADIDANQAGDEQDEDYREHMKRLLKQRARLAPVRLECERPLSPVMEKLMLKKLGLKRSQVYDTIVPLDLSFTWSLGSRLSDNKSAKLSNPPFSPAWPPYFDRKARIIDQVQNREVLLSYPYESIDPFVQLLREAANDPDVISIKITLYRLASQSHIAEALIAAADAGKEVTALFELRARFDENNNIEWSQKFEQAGCNVLYGFRDYKVHSKICCITRRTPEGGIQHITQLGTGNYNEKTARLYTDFSFITTNEVFGRDALEFFRNMQLENVSDSYAILRVAPLQIKSMILDNLDKQIARAQAGLPATAFMKANSITDKDVIEKISEASCAGVKVTLFIRGICCLVPRVKGSTDNVRVVSIVGRLLEHSRIYCFGPASDCTIYLSSADLMTRNLNKRIEIAWPLLDPGIRNQVLTYIDTCMRDTAKLRELRPNATYTPLGAFCDLDEEGNPEPAFDAQAALIAQAAGTTAAPAALTGQLSLSLAPDGATTDVPEIDNVAEAAASEDVAPAADVPEIDAVEAEADVPEIDTAVAVADVPAGGVPGIDNVAADVPKIDVAEAEAPEDVAPAADASGIDVAAQPDDSAAVTATVPEAEPSTEPGEEEVEDLTNMTIGELLEIPETENAEATSPDALPHEQEMQPEPEIGLETKLRSGQESATDEAPSFEPEPPVATEPAFDVTQTQAGLSQSDSELDDLHNLEFEPEPNAETPESSDADANPGISPNTTSERVSALIAQLSSTTDFSASVAEPIAPLGQEPNDNDNLTEMSVGEILGPENGSGIPSEPSSEAAPNLSPEEPLGIPSPDSESGSEPAPVAEPTAETELAPEPASRVAAEPSSEPAPEPSEAPSPAQAVDNAFEDAVAAVPESASETTTDAGQTAAAAQPGETPTQAPTEAAQPASGDTIGFFEGSGREIEMPPEKKGFFSRFRKNG